MAGQREWGWACQQLGIPSFPRDFADCQAAAELAQLQAAEHVCSPHLLPIMFALFPILKELSLPDIWSSKLCMLQALLCT